MSERNGDRARFHKDRLRRLHHRQRIRLLLIGLNKRAKPDAGTRMASSAMQDEGGPVRNGD